MSYILYISFAYTCHFLLGFMSANTLEADTGNNCMYSKVLSLYETVISVCIYPKVSSLYETVTYAMYYVTQWGRIYPKVSSLYETVTYACNDPKWIYVIDPNGASISVSVSICCSNCDPIDMPIYPSNRF